MSISVNNALNNKALFLLKNFGELNNNRFNTKNLQEKIESLIKPFIDKSLENTPIGQKWHLIFAISLHFPSYSLERVFRAAIQAAPNSSEEDVQQVFTDLKQKPGLDLNQIYTERYPMQFLAWIQNEIHFLPSDSLLLLLEIWRNFGNKSIEEAWKKLSLSNGTPSQRQALNTFKSKHDFIIKNHEALRHIKLQAAAASDNVRIPISIKSTSRQYLNQYVLWAKALSSLFGEIADSYGFCAIGFNKNSWEYQLLYAPKKISPKILSWRVKKIFPSYQDRIQPFIDFFDKKINTLEKDREEARGKIDELECILEQIKDGMPVYGSSNVKGTKMVSEEKAKKDKKNKPISEEQIKTYLKNWKETEKSLRIELDKPTRLQRDISNVEFLLDHLIKSFIVKKSEQEITQDQIALIEKNQRELIEEEDKFISSQKKMQKASSVEISDSETEIDSDTEVTETLSSSDSKSSNAVVFNTPPLLKPSFSEMDAFLKTGGPVNGCLSKSIEGILKQVKAHLLKIQADIPEELKALGKEKAHEIHTQLVLATADLESTTQAIEDRRFDHVVLGFRSTLIHCHFAIEQILSLKILLESNEITNTHDLIDLAAKANIDILKEEFLKDMGIHLCFCYPADYRFFHPENTHPKPFLLLNKLFHPYKDAAGQKLDIDIVKESIQLCFTMYNQTIEFIMETTKAPTEDSNRFLEKIEEIQNQLQNNILRKRSNKHFKNETPILQKCNQALNILNRINALDSVQDFEKKLLLPLNTMKEYLRLMQISLSIPKESNNHCLQTFIQVETLVNMDKLFKHLFRTVVLLQTGEDNHSHDLSALFALIEGFYKEGLVTEQDKQDLKDLNISITQHYLHKNSNASLKKEYKSVFDLAQRLNLSEKDFMLISKGQSISYKALKTKTEAIFKKLDSAFELFIKLLEPVAFEIGQLNDLF